MGSIELFIPEGIILLGALTAFGFSVAGATYRASWLASVLVALAGLAASAAFVDGNGEPFFPGIYRVDAFSQVLKLGITAGLVLTLLASERLGSVIKHARVDTPVFLMLSALGMMMLVSATELLTLYVALELSAYGLYILAALHTMQRHGSEGAAKYVLYGAVSSAVSLYGVSLIYGVTHSTYLDAIAQAPMSPLFAVGVLLASSGLLFKLAVFPFHAWAPDTYEAAPHEAVAFIGTASKVAAVGILVRLLTLAVPDHASLATAVAVLCVASMTVGNLAALAQNDIKRLLAYSAIAQAGYILIGLVCFSELGVASALFYALVYVPIAFCAFLAVSVLGANGTNPTKATLAGLYRRSPLLAATLLVGMFGLAGIPPTSGFAGKWFLFSAAIERELFWLVLVGAANATISLYYYLHVIKEAYLTPPTDDTAVVLSPAATVAAWLSIAGVVVVGFYPAPLWELAEAGARVAGALLAR